jgi:hypothetical protein
MKICFKHYLSVLVRERSPHGLCGCTKETLETHGVLSVGVGSLVGEWTGRGFLGSFIVCVYMGVLAVCDNLCVSLWISVSVSLYTCTCFYVYVSMKCFYYIFFFDNLLSIFFLLFFFIIIHMCIQGLGHYILKQVTL